jgi:hypothetical protein
MINDAQQLLSAEILAELYHLRVRSKDRSLLTPMHTSKLLA